MEDITSSIQKKGTNKNYFSILIICVGAIVTTSVAFSLLHIMFIKYCKNRRQTPQILTTEPSASTGLEKRVLNTIPILFYSSRTCQLYRINQGDQCVICLGPLNKGDLVRWLPNCGHVFHVPCIDHWFHARTTCPICRTIVRWSRPSWCERSLLTRTRSGGLLRDSSRLMLPIQGLAGPRDLIKVGLKRSLSMDEFCVEIDPREQQTSSSSCSSSVNNNYNNNNNDCCNSNYNLSKVDFLLSRLYQGQCNNRRFNQNMSSTSNNMGFRSLHMLREERGVSLRTNGILPY